MLTDATRLSGLTPEIEGPAVARQTCGLSLYSKYDSTLTPCAAPADTPEAPHLAALVLSGLAALALVVLARRRDARSPKEVYARE